MLEGVSMETAGEEVSLTRDQLAVVTKRAIVLYRSHATLEMIEEKLVEEGTAPATAAAVAGYLDRYLAARKKRTIGLLMLIGGVGVAATLLVLTLTGVVASGQYVLFYGIIGVGLGLFVAGRREVEVVGSAMIHAATGWNTPASE